MRTRTVTTGLAATLLIVAGTAMSQDEAPEVPVLSPAGTIAIPGAFPRDIAISPDGKLLATASEDMAILWDATTGALKHRLVPEGESPKASSVAFSPDGKTLAVGGNLGDVFFWDPATGKLKGKFDDPSLSVACLAYNRDGSILAALHDQASVMLYDVKDAKKIDVLKPASGSVTRFGFSFDGKTLVGIAGPSLVFWDVATRAVRKTVDVGSRADLAGFQAMACSPVEALAVVAGGPLLKQTTTSWNLKSFQPLGALATDETDSGFVVLTFSPNGRLLAGGVGGSPPGRPFASLWETMTGRKVAMVAGPTEHVYAIAFSGDGRRMAIASGENSVRLYLLPGQGGGLPTKGRTKGKSTRTKR